MKLNNKIIEQEGFKRINNSMFRFGYITLQNDYANSGGNLYERIFTTKKAYKVCIKGKYSHMITTVNELLYVKFTHSEQVK